MRAPVVVGLLLVAAGLGVACDTPSGRVVSPRHTSPVFTAPPLSTQILTQTPSATSTVPLPPEEPVVAEPTKPRPLARKDGTPSDALLLSADELFDKGSFKESEEAYKKAMKLAPKDPAPIVGAARARLAKDEVPVDFNSAPKNATLTSCVAELRRATKLDKDYAQAHLELGRALLVQGKAEDALASIRRALELDGTEAEAHSALGVGMLATGDLENAVLALVKAAELEPKSAARHSNAGTALVAAGRLPEGIRAYERALKLAPKDPSTLSDLGTALLASNEVDKAVDILTKAKALAPKNPAILSNLGYAMRIKGDLKAAETEFRAALALDDKLVSAWINLGSVQAIAGNYGEARASFDKAKAIDPTDPRVIATLAELDELEKSKKP